MATWHRSNSTDLLVVCLLLCRMLVNLLRRWQMPDEENGFPDHYWQRSSLQAILVIHYPQLPEGMAQHSMKSVCLHTCKEWAFSWCLQSDFWKAKRLICMKSKVGMVSSLHNWRSQLRAFLKCTQVSWTWAAKKGLPHHPVNLLDRPRSWHNWLTVQKRTMTAKPPANSTSVHTHTLRKNGPQSFLTEVINKNESQHKT